MEIEFDPDKNERNKAVRGFGFDRVADFDFDTALIQIDDRRDYGELRYTALGLIEGRIYALVFKETDPGIRVISFRKANRREVRKYAQS